MDCFVVVVLVRRRRRRQLWERLQLHSRLNDRINGEGLRRLALVFAPSHPATAAAKMHAVPVDSTDSILLNTTRWTDAGSGRLERRSDGES